MAMGKAVKGIGIRLSEEVFNAVKARDGNVSQYVRRLISDDLEGKTYIKDEHTVIFKFKPEFAEKIRRVARYRKLQGRIDTDDVQQYVLKLIAVDMAQAIKEIESRRRL